MGLVNLRPEEISSVIKEQIKNYTAKLETTDVGTVIQVAAVGHYRGIVRAVGAFCQYDQDRTYS